MGAALTITSGYGPRRIVVGGRLRTYPHQGIDVRSPRGSAVPSLFSGRVVKVVAGRSSGAPIGLRDPRTGVAALAATVSGNGVIIARDGGGYYVEVHMAPAVVLGQRVEVGTTLGHTDLSGQIEGAHRHIELWSRLHPGSHYDPTAEVRAATSGRNITAGKDWFTMATLDELRTVVREEIDARVWGAQIGRGDARRTMSEVVADIAATLDAVPAATASAVWNSSVGRGERRRTLAAALVNAETDADAAVTILGAEL